MNVHENLCHFHSNIMTKIAFEVNNSQLCLLFDITILQAHGYNVKTH